MVQNKHFKSRVRARMEKTGESYTAARSHLLAAAATDIPAVAGMVPGYSIHSAPTQRDAGLWARVLAQAGVTDPLTGKPFSEAMLAGLAGGIGFMMFTFEYQEVTTATVVTRFHPGPYLGNLITRSGAEILQQTTGSPSVAKTRLDSALDAGVPVVVRVTPGRLAPGDAPGDAPAHEESVDVVVAGRRGTEYLIDQGTSSLAMVPGPDLAAARSQRKADRHWQAHVTGPGQTSPHTQAGLIRTAMLETAQALLNTNGQTGVPERFHKNFGVTGMQTWADKLRDTRSKKGWPQLFADDRRRYQALTQVQEFLAGDAWSGSGALRPLYAGFLDEAAAGSKATPGSKLPLQELGRTYKDLGNAWDSFADMINPACSPDDVKEHFAHLASTLESLARDEASAAKALLEAAGSASVVRGGDPEPDSRHANEGDQSAVGRL